VSEAATEQVAREKRQREAARGRRARSVLRGDLGPVLKRWVSATVLPVGARLRAFCEHHRAGRYKEAGAVLNSPVFGLPEATASRDLEPILAWCLKGQSSGRAAHGTTYAEDIVLAVVGTAVLMACRAMGDENGGGRRGGGDYVTLTSVLRAAGGAARETAMGQFLTEVQGAKSMQRVRGSKDHTWQEGKQMDAIAALLAGQVRSGIDDDLEVGGKAVVTVVSAKGDGHRRIALRKPAAGDWELLEVARRVKGEADRHGATWMSFAMLVICAAQAEGGLFDLVRVRGRSRDKWKGKAPHGLALSGPMQDAILKDLDKWLAMGFVKEPMLVPPDNGDYLTVKHRPIVGRNGPRGVRTDARGTEAWRIASEVMAASPWTVATETHRFCGSVEGEAYVVKSEPDPSRRAMVLGAYARLATEPAFYLPIYMDFRGRVYMAPTFVTNQGGDLQKGLLCLPPNEVGNDLSADSEEFLIRYCASLYGGPGKLDKAPMKARESWWYEVQEKSLEEACRDADKPIQLYTALSLHRSGEGDRIPCQIDGTCNGLQHLTAMFRDETAAPYVNLVESSYEDTPSDIYGVVAGIVRDRLLLRSDAWATRLAHTLKIDRKVCKGPVMVLPYGGTRGTVDQAAMDGVLAQGPVATMVNGLKVDPWKECLTWADGGWIRDEEAVAGNYLAFRDRDLDAHPLLRLDTQRLGGMIWQAIVETIPRPMAAMKAFRDIARFVGDRSLEWTVSGACGVGASTMESISHGVPLRLDPWEGSECIGDLGDTQRGSPLWVVQAKAVAEASWLNLKGLHLPSTVRGLGMRLGRDEVDPRAHTSGIVANYIHSQDADHLMMTGSLFRRAAHTLGIGDPPLCFGANHDCYVTRPSLMPLLARVTREAFLSKYAGEGPLGEPVRLRSVTGRGSSDTLTEYPSWYALAEAAHTQFPERGSWDPREVLNSAWFFS
jgi:hypothetical protein